MGGGRARRRRAPRAGRGRAGRRAAPARPRRPGRRRHPALARPRPVPHRRRPAAPRSTRRPPRRHARRSPPRPPDSPRPPWCCAASRAPRPPACARALETAPPELAGELEEQLVEALAYSDDDADEYLERLEPRARRPARRRRVRPALLAHLAHARALAGATREDVLPPARRALADPRVFARLGVERFAALWAIEALLAVEAAPEALAAARAMTDLTNRSGSRASAGAAAWIEARWERRFGNLRRAEDLARLSIELAGDQLIAAMASGSTLIGVLLDRGDVDGAREAAAALPVAAPDRRDRRPVRRPGAAAAQPRAAPRRRSSSSTSRRPRTPRARWTVGIREDNHILRVRALAALGRDDEARALAEREIAAAPRPAARAAPRRSPASPARRSTPTRSPQLEAAVAAARAASAPARPRHRARRPRRRAAPRRPPRRGPRARCARPATAPTAAAPPRSRRSVHEELVIAGARPQRLAFSGVDALTASERRVAELAVRGLRNREIAEALFVEPQDRRGPPRPRLHQARHQGPLPARRSPGVIVKGSDPSTIQRRCRRH